MSLLQQLPLGLDVSPVLADLEAHPDLWNRHPERAGTGSPHEGVDDIWLRYRAKAELTEPRRYLEPFSPAFYPEWRLLPSLRPIVFGLMARLQAVQLGGILITRIPPGGQVRPHDDCGSWHAGFFNRKLYLPLRSNGRCVNTCGAESAVMHAGDIWTFDNQVTHSVRNAGDTERMTLIVCLRCEE